MVTMSVKNLSQKNYDRFVKNKNIDIFSQEEIKNIPRHRLVMMNNGKGETYWPFNVHGLHNYLQHTNQHPVFRSVRVSPDAKKRIRDKYIASLRHDTKAMLSASSRVSEDNFVKALKKARLSNAVINVLVKARRDKTVPNTVVQNIRPNTIDHVMRILRANNNKNTTKVPNAAKAFVNAQRRKHEQMLSKQQRHQAELELNKNQNALGRASSIVQRVMADVTYHPSKKEFKYPELGFKMTIQNTNMVIMTWYRPSRKRNRTGEVIPPNSSSSIRVPIEAMKFTNWGYMPVSQNNANVSKFWFVPEIPYRVPGSRVSVRQMSKAVLLLLKERIITDGNRLATRNNRNIGGMMNTINNMMQNISQNGANDEIYTFFLDTGKRAYPVSRNNNAIPTIIRRVLTALNRQALVGIDEIHLNKIEVHTRGGTSIEERVNTRLPDVNINRLAQSNAFTTLDQTDSITFSGSFTNLYAGSDSYFVLDINPHESASDGVDVEIN
jgi:hypothetical protein